VRGQPEELELVLRGQVNEHHRYLLAELRAELEFVEDRLGRLDQQRTTSMQPYTAHVGRLRGIPGVSLLTAWTLIAELGADRSLFPDAAHAVGGAGLCPGNRASAGKRLSSRSKKGKRGMRRALCQSAWAVTRKRNCHLTALFYRMTARRGVKKAIVAVAHQILVTAYSILRDQSEYRELGGDFFAQQHPQRTQNRLVRRLERLGLQVVIIPAKPKSEPGSPGRGRGRPCQSLERGNDCKHRPL
jgi:transposase